METELKIQAARAIKARRRSWSKGTTRKFLLGLAFTSPWLIGFFAFTLYPMVASLYYSFTEYYVKKPPVWIGLTNYAGMFKDELFLISLRNTGYMVLIAVPLTLLLSFLCAVLLNLKLKGQAIYRVVYFLPSIVPTVAGTLLFVWILNPNTGLLNSALESVGITSPNWFANPYWAKPALILMGLWGMGQTIIIYLAGLQDVPQTLLEAAEIDGASWWQRLMNVTIPMVSPLTLFNLIIGVIGMFQYFAQAYVFGTATASTGTALGAPLNSTLFYSVYLYTNAFRYLKMGYASALAWVLFIIILGCTLLLLRTSNRWTYYSG